MHPRSVDLTHDGTPVITLTNGHVFLYQPRMKWWARIADHSWPASAYLATVAGHLGSLSMHSAAAAAARPRALLRAGLTAVRHCHALILIRMPRCH